MILELITIFTFLVIGSILRPEEGKYILQAGYNFVVYILFCVKYSIFKVLIGLKQRNVRQNRKDRDPKKFWECMLPSQAETERERRQHPIGEFSNDTVAFQGCDLQGNHILIRMALRPNGLMEIWLVVILVHDGKPTVFVHPSHPNGIVLQGDDDRGWTGGGLKCELRQAMKKWRVSYSGWLRRLNSLQNYPVNGKFDGKCEHVRLSFIWNALSDEIDFDCDLSASLTASCIAENHFSAKFLKSLQSAHETRYEQWGQMNGSVTMENGDEAVLTLRGMRDHCYGARDWNKYNRYIALMGYAHDGTFFHVGLVSIKDGVKQFKYGYVGTDSADVNSIESSSMKFDELGSQGDPPASFSFAFTADGKFYQVIAQVKSQVQVFNGINWESKSFLTFFDFEVNGASGTGFGEFEYNKKPEKVTENLNLRQPIIRNTDINQMNVDDRKNMVLPLSHQNCLCEELVGGKAKQLAQLISLQQDFSIPSGFVVTTHSFGVFIEDGMVSSSAGQMDTYLNVKGLDHIFSSIVKCWASAFSEQALQYRRQNSVALMSQMGVIVQEMVPAAVAGIMFTCDPLTGNPGQTVINATKGLGEAVASGTVEPDTIVMRHTFEKPSEFTYDTETSCNESECCLWGGQLSFLCQVGQQIESAFNSPRDIEWAFDSSGHLFLLQSRPVTGLNQETLTELYHEFDSPVFSDNEYSTTHNVGEVLPGVITPLGISISCNAIDKGVQFQMEENGVIKKMHANLNLMLTVYSSKTLLRLSQSIYRDGGCANAKNRQIMDICVMGRALEDKNLDEILKNKFKNISKFENIKGLARAIKMVYNGLKRKEQLFKTAANLDKTCQSMYLSNDPAVILDEIEGLFEPYCQGWLAHSGTSGVSAVYYHIIFAILSSKLKDSEWNDVTLSDIATIYSSCNQVESADIPKSLELIARQLIKERNETVLDNKSATECLKWLNSEASDRAGVLFRKFMKRHGHRCISEIDLLEKTWAEDPSNFIGCIKATCKRLAQSETKAKLVHPSSEKVISHLKTSLNALQRASLHYFLPKAKQAVSNREHTKSTTMKVSYQVRLLYRHLGQVLYDHKILPDLSLLYFLTHVEVRQLVHDVPARATLIRLARRRSTIRPQLEKVQLPEISIGYPKPMESNEAESQIGGDSVTGTVVSSGVAIGRACVCHSLKDAVSFIQAGDILIAYSTDIAWSLYFPILSGVVTELGGLLSHGAVVAREYGLPCLVSAKGAVHVFETGAETLRLCMFSV